jgi:hypothetical protein
MMAQLEITPPGQDRFPARRVSLASSSLVLVASEPAHGRGDGGQRRDGFAEPSHRRPAIAGPNGLQCIQIPAHAVAGSAAWCRRRGHLIGASPRFAEPTGAAPGHASDLPENPPGILGLLEQEEGACDNREAIAGAIVALRAADAVIAGPLSPDDANAPGLLPHLAHLAGQAYRALRPPRELIVHPAFAQVARRFDFIQMSRWEARVLGAGASDLGILAQRLRRLQGDPGEFAITAFDGHGLVWADDAWWEIEPIDRGDRNEAVAGAVFCMAWVVARRFRRAGAAQALAYARAMAAATVNPIHQRRTRLPSK